MLSSTTSQVPIPDSPWRLTVPGNFPERTRFAFLTINRYTGTGNDRVSSRAVVFTTGVGVSGVGDYVDNTYVAFVGERLRDPVSLENTTRKTSASIRWLMFDDDSAASDDLIIILENLKMPTETF